MPPQQSPRDKGWFRGDRPARRRTWKRESWTGHSWSLRCLSIRWRCRRSLAMEDPLQTPQDAGSHIENGDSEKRRPRKIPDRRDEDGNEHDQAEGMARAKIDVLEAVKTPGADHEIADHHDHHEPAQRRHPRSHG